MAWCVGPHLTMTNIAIRATASVQSAEFKMVNNPTSSPFFHYDSRFDAETIGATPSMASSRRRACSQTFSAFSSTPNYAVRGRFRRATRCPDCALFGLQAATFFSWPKMQRAYRVGDAGENAGPIACLRLPKQPARGIPGAVDARLVRQFACLRRPTRVLLAPIADPFARHQNPARPLLRSARKILDRSTTKPTSDSAAWTQATSGDQKLVESLLRLAANFSMKKRALPHPRRWCAKLYLLRGVRRDRWLK
jgi:hypothetical protein